MRFVRVTISHTLNRVVSVADSDVPFPEAAACALVVGHECELVDLGVLEDQEWTDAAGNPVTLGEHVLQRLESGNAGIAKIHDCPCTLSGIRQRLRKQGLAGIPVKVRAWLASVLPSDVADSMGIARGLPVSVMKSVEIIRNRRDPASGSRIPQLEAIARAQSGARSVRKRAKSTKRGEQ